MWVKKRHKVFHFFFRWIVYLYCKIKYKFKSKIYRLSKEPHLIIFNHPSNFDPIFVGASFSRPTYFIANEDLFTIPYVSKILNFLVAPIPKQKSVRDLSTIRTSLKIVKEGGNIGVAPEGSRTYSGKLNYIDPSIVKFIQLLKVPVIMYVIEGGFGANPRFDNKLRKGRITAEVKRVLSKEEVLSLSGEEIYEIILNTLEVDDSNLGREYKTKNQAEYMESVFYLCPNCKKFHTIKSEGNNIVCRNCGLEAEYLPNLKFASIDNKFPFSTTKEYYEFQSEYIANYEIEKLKFIDYNVSIYDAAKKRKRELLYIGTLEFDNEKFIIRNEESENIFYHEDIVSVAILYHNTLIINLDDIKYHLVGDERFNAYKYVQIFDLLRSKKKGS